jgi:replicative DNA helicase Mcm
MGQMVVIEGIVRQASDVRPQIVNAKFECPSCGTIISVLQVDKKFREPSRCSCGRKTSFKLISKEMVDAQRLVIEESPESMEGGEQPRRMSVFLKEDLVEPLMEERTTPGARIRIIGILKEVPIPLQTGGISTRFDLAIEANNVIPLEETSEEIEVTEEEERQIKELAADPKIYEKLGGSIAPSIFGYDEIKLAIALQLLGGVRKNRSDKTHARGDIHILLVGDPGVAKSVLLKFVSGVAPKGRYIVGKAATQAGITATVVRDEFLRGWALEAGAMVLANHGVACLDEMEKMNEQDRSAMHEAMEQQCYHYDTNITLADGSEAKIGQLVDDLLEENKNKVIRGKDCLILPVENVELLTTDFKRIFKTKVARVSKHKAFDKFIKVKFGNGREIIVTPEHPVFCVEDGQIVTKRTDLIKIGDGVPVPLNLPIEGQEQYFNYAFRNELAKTHIKIPEKNNETFFKIIGYLLSEGSREINRGKIIGVNFTNKDSRLLDDFEDSMLKIFNLTPYKQSRIDEHGTRYMYRYISTELARFFLTLMPEVLKASGEKQIPKSLMKGRKQDIAKMLSALFEGDGYVAIKKRTIRIGYSTKSKRLAEQIQDLLLRFGIRSNLTLNREYFKVLITSYENIKKFSEQISFVTSEKNKIIAKYLEEKTIKRTVKDIIPVSFNERIIDIIKEEKIKRVGKYKTYGIIFDHLKRKDKFSFSRNLLKNLIKLVKKQENIIFLEQFTGEIGWEKVTGLEIINNENEEWAYDVTVEPNHTFISQACVLHNTVTISKANVQATLRAETSVLGAANPKFGRFDLYQPVAQQIEMAPTLINRFDLIFVIKDLPHRLKDEAIATHVLLEHRRAAARPPIEQPMLKKFIAYAKTKVFPELTEKAVEEIKRFYVELRNAPAVREDLVRPIPISARQLEALIRLSEASARARLSKKVTKEDAKRAIQIMHSYLLQVGIDRESGSIDIDRITTGIPASERSKIVLVREAIIRLESRIGKLVPIEELRQDLAERIQGHELDEIVDKLKRSGDVFEPKRGFVQRI